MNERAKPDFLHRERLRRMIDGYRISQVVHVAAELRIADLLQDGPKGAEELAAATRADAGALFRVLQCLVSLGVLDCLEGNRFALAPLGEWLRSDHDESLRAWALLSARMYRAWGGLLDSTGAGKTGLGSGHGKRRWERLEQSPEEAHLFHGAMAAMSAWISRAVLDVYDFSPFRRIVDVGGANAALMTSILGTYPSVHGIVFDLPEAVSEARSRLEAAGLSARCELHAGSFFDLVPPGGDLYVLSRVLHDWDNDHAEQILNCTRKAMTPGTTLLIIERLLDPESPSSEVTLSDLNLLLMNGGRERTPAEFEALLGAARFELTRVVTMQAPIQILEAVAI